MADLPTLYGDKGARSSTSEVQYLGFGGIRMAENEANAHYNSLQIDVHGQVTRDLQLQTGYTYSKAVDATTSNGSGGDFNNVTNPYAGWRYDSRPRPLRPRTTSCSSTSSTTSRSSRTAAAC